MKTICKPKINTALTICERDAIIHVMINRKQKWIVTRTWSTHEMITIKYKNIILSLETKVFSDFFEMVE